MYASFNPTLYSKTGAIHGYTYFSYFCPNHILWVLVRTASVRKIYQNFSIENFQILKAQKSLYMAWNFFFGKVYYGLTQKCAIILTSIVFCIMESEHCRNFFPVTMPALFTRISTCPTSCFTYKLNIKQNVYEPCHEKTNNVFF